MYNYDQGQQMTQKKMHQMHLLDVPLVPTIYHISLIMYQKYYNLIKAYQKAGNTLFTRLMFFLFLRSPKKLPKLNFEKKI